MDNYNQQLIHSWVADVGEFPLYAKATVVTGFGRGSKQMGIPTGKHIVSDLLFYNPYLGKLQKALPMTMDEGSFQGRPSFV